MSERQLSLAAMEKIMKKCGASRVGDDAKTELKDVVESIAEEIAQGAVRYAAHAGRKTIKASDIKLAAKTS
ncbi:NFYB/HAP3 family transcription factor subunit [Candidatus Woesearchaeota archaeon]|nr:NFYB/HAP3 family transcription factor subunit [Candidatus Woesearchaeota archaeon]